MDAATAALTPVFNWVNAENGQNLGIVTGLAIGGESSGGPVTGAPEPGTLALFGVGLLGLAGLRRRRR